MGIAAVQDASLHIDDALFEGPFPPVVVRGPRTRRSTELIGRVLRGTYRILRTLDTGGMAVVYEAVHLRLRRLVAVKFVAPHLGGDPTTLRRFRREAEALSRLSHPNIVSVLDFDTAETGEPYLVLELLHGETLAKRLERERMLPLGAVQQIVAQVGSALETAHRALVVHRDLKPENIFLEMPTGDGIFARVLDFGISAVSPDPKLTGEHAVLGTPGYMAPEQAGGARDVDHRADQFALAAIIYEMLAGRPLFTGPDAYSVMMRVIGETPRPLAELAPWARTVSDVVMRALSKQPRDRFTSIAEFVEAFDTAAPTPSSPRPYARAVRAFGTTPERQKPVPPRSLDPSSPSAWGSMTTLADCEHATAEDVNQIVERARRALERGDIVEAAMHAEMAFDAGRQTSDTKAAAVVEFANALIGHIFVMRLGGPRQRLSPAQRTTTRLALSAREAFLMSRIEGGVTLDDALDLAALPRLVALRHLAGLARRGLVALG